jgi:hypothetical protein
MALLLAETCQRSSNIHVYQEVYIYLEMNLFLHILVAWKMYNVEHCFYFISCDFLDDRSGCDMLLD